MNFVLDGGAKRSFWMVPALVAVFVFAAIGCNDSDESKSADSDSDTGSDSNTDSDSNSDTDSDSNTDSDTDSDSDTDTETESDTVVLKGDEYSLGDDGTPEVTYGINANAQLWWGQGLPATGKTTIKGVKVVFGSANPAMNSGTTTNGDKFAVHVYEDPSDNGILDDLQLLGSKESRVRFINTDTYENVALDKPVTVTDNFFVAVSIVGQNMFTPVAMDFSTGNVKLSPSYLGAGSVGFFDPEDLIGTSNIVNARILDKSEGVWLLRAVGE